MSFILFPKTISGRIRCYSIFMVLVPLIFITATLLFFIKSTTFKTARTELAEQVASHEIVIEEWLKERQDDVKFLAETEAVRSGDKSLIIPMLQKFDNTHDDINGVVWVDPTGFTRERAGLPSIDVSDREYFIQGRAGNPHVTKVLIGRASGKPLILFSHPVTTKGSKFGGVVFLAARLTAIDKLMKNLRFGNSGETYILNRDGYMLTESRYLNELKAQGRVKDSTIMEVKTSTRNLEAALVGKQPDGTYIDYRGTEVIGASRWVKDGNWLIISELGYNEVMAPIYSFVWIVFTGAALTLLILIPLSVRMVHSINVPLKNLTLIAGQMTKGIFNCECRLPEEISPPEEVIKLMDGFCAMQNKVDSTVQELQKSAITDQLTQLPNRRYLMKEGTRLVDIAIRAGQPCSLMIIDIDHFKIINDTYGHTVGDTVLKQMGKAFQEIVRTSDIVSRYGGEEFVVVAPGSGIESSKILAERLRKGIESRPFNNEKQPLHCTISIGVAHYATDIIFGLDAYEDMLARADKALYKAKDSGRNKVVLAEIQNTAEKE
ncbi:sensor domain-containing diguanylate cyclase [Maridesulfovibrio sp.]|uniref:sensor domain-containing diguanylate cyclase n=1 Tax=unclassified Maridesulfovibrio TaxID=2794999 RepID=UPI003AFF7155